MTCSSLGKAGRERGLLEAGWVRAEEETVDRLLVRRRKRNMERDREPYYSTVQQLYGLKSWKKSYIMFCVL